MRVEKVYHITFQRIYGRGWRWCVGFEGSKHRWSKTFEHLDDAIMWCLDHGTELIWHASNGAVLEHWRRVND